jgi:hypothetical protein
VEGMGVDIAPNCAVLSLNVATDVKPGIISRGNLGNMYLNEFVHGKVPLFFWGGAYLHFRLLKAGWWDSVTNSRDLSWCRMFFRVHPVLSGQSQLSVNTVELGYNDLGWCNTSAIALYIQWYQLIPNKARVFLACLVRHA